MKKKNIEPKKDETEKQETGTALIATAPAFLKIINDAVKSGMSLEVIKELRDIRDQEQAKIAKEEFILDMNRFKQECPNIVKDKTNNQFKSKYSSIGAIVADAVPTLSKYGFSHRWDYPKPVKDGYIAVTCVLQHKLGHVETVTVEAPPDSESGISNSTGRSSKNPIQQIKSTFTYLKIITFEAVTGLVATDGNLDDDGNSAAGSGSMSENSLLDWIAKIDQAKDIDDLTAVYKEAHAAAAKANDGTSLMHIIRAKESRHKALKAGQL